RYAIAFWAEIALMALPLLIFRIRRAREDSRLLFIGALCMISGGALWRLNYPLLAFNPGGGYNYFPPTSEILISIGFVAIEVCAYILLIRLLPVLPAHGQLYKNNQTEVKHEPTHHH
ncbi:Ni/Fe-hydrogenase cytochrome b subunit, partial [Enterobacter bugandensis]|nr:Ni/Fe-hydrogenase cytochrome b subunit [Enterobacter bugandensis]